MKDKLPPKLTKAECIKICPSWKTSTYAFVFTIMNREDENGLIDTNNFIDAMKEGDKEGDRNREINDSLLYSMNKLKGDGDRATIKEDRKM